MKQEMQKVEQCLEWVLNIDDKHENSFIQCGKRTAQLIKEILD